MTLDYGELLSPEPIMLSIGSIRKPTLLEISRLTFTKFNYYEFFLKLTPEIIYNNIYGEEGKQKWASFSDDEKSNLSTFTIIANDPNLQKIYVEVLDYFFIERIVYYKEAFLVLRNNPENESKIKDTDIIGIINSNSFQQVLEIIQQTCCIYTKPPQPISEIKFKNKLAEKLYKKIEKAKAEKQKSKELNKDHTIPNIISAVSNKHLSLNPVNIWDLTLFQLIDSFNRLQVNAVYDINQLRVSVWGDEKKTFDSTLWYKNNNDD